MPLMKRCRACTSTRLYVFHEMGDHPPANAFVKRERLNERQPSYPLDSNVCLDCALVQIPDQLPKDFFSDYVYIPSASDTMHAHFANFAKKLEQRFIGPGQRVVDIGCNDGLFLKACKDIGLSTLGIEPAVNIAALARAKGIEVVNDYFTPDLATRVAREHGPAQVIVTTNTFNHIDDLHAFMRGVDVLLAADGTMMIEVPQALTFIEHNEFDTVYHEHLSVFSVTSMAALGRFFGMHVVDLDVLPIHGGSMRVHLQRVTAGRQPAPVVKEFLDRERAQGLFEAETYDRFRERVETIRSDLMRMLRELKQQGKKLAGYGAPAKGNTLLNYYGIGPDILDYLADRNTLKQGLYSPGKKIPVVSPDRILETMPDYLLILAWNFGDEIMAQQAEYRRRGGRFILPIPEPRIVG